MKKIENNFAVTGFVGKDAEIRQFTTASVARFSLIIATFASSELPQNSTKKKRGTTGYTQRLSIKDLNIPRMFG